MLGIAQSGEGGTLKLLPPGMPGAQETDHRAKWGSVVLNGFLGGHQRPEARKMEAIG